MLNVNYWLTNSYKQKNRQNPIKTRSLSIFENCFRAIFGTSCYGIVNKKLIKILKIKSIVVDVNFKINF